MNTKPLSYLGCFLAATLATSTLSAGPHRAGANHFAPIPARVGFARPFASGNRIAAWNGQHWNGQHFVGQHWDGQHWAAQHWNGQHWNGHWSNNWNWHHHHHDHDVVFISDFGFPFWGWWGYPYYYSYPYGYPYGYYGSGYYVDPGYGYGYGNGYDNGYAYGYGNHYDAKVAELQRRLTNAGYYRGEIDGIFGPRTQYALKAYRHDHPSGNGDYNTHNYPTLRDHPYSPPPTTTEPSPSE